MMGMPAIFNPCYQEREEKEKKEGRKKGQKEGGKERKDGLFYFEVYRVDRQRNIFDSLRLLSLCM